LGVGSVAPRVLAVNTEANVAHLPGALRAALAQAAPGPDDATGFATLAANIAEVVAQHDTLFGEAIDPETMRWLPSPAKSSGTRFTGRSRELLDLHGLLTGKAEAGQPDARSAAVVDGMGGAGKTVLAIEYPRRFCAAWPGGIVWLSGHGYDRDKPDTSSLSTELSSLAASLDIDTPELRTHTQLRTAIAHRLGSADPLLWIVDDLAPGEPIEDWQAPMPNGTTLVTTRNRSYSGVLQPMHLDQLSEPDAFALLTRGHPPTDPGQKPAAQTICERLGHHALAIDVTRATIKSPDGYQARLDILLAEPIDALTRRAERVSMLPNAHTPYVVATLLASIEALTPNARRLLEIAACFESLPLPTDTLTDVSKTLDPGVRRRLWRRGGGGATSETVGESLDELVDHSLAKEDGNDTTTLHRLVIDITRDLGVSAEPVLAAAEASLTSTLQAISDESNLRRLRPHYLLASSLTVEPASNLPDWLGVYEQAVGNVRLAIDRGEQLVADRERVLVPDHPFTLTSRNNLAHAYRSVGDLGRAIPLFEATLNDRERVLGPDHPDTLTSRNNLAHAYELAGDLGRAIPLFEATLNDRERVLGPDHPNALTSRNNLAGAYRSAGDLGRAIPLFEATLNDRERVLGPDHPNALTSRNNLAGAYELAGDLGRAIPLFEATLNDRERVLGPDHPDTLASRNDLALAWWTSGDHARGLAEMTVAAETADRVLSADHPLAMELRDQADQMKSMLESSESDVS
jgi:tetratricopeptide (TPR) repeat protein